MLTLKTSNNKPLVNKKPEIWSENPIVSSSLLLSSVLPRWGQVSDFLILPYTGQHSRFQPEFGSTVKFNVLGILDAPPLPHVSNPQHTFTDIATMCLAFYTASSGSFPAIEEYLGRLMLPNIFFIGLFLSIK